MAESADVISYAYLDTPIGPFLVAGDETGLLATRFTEGARRRPPEAGWREDTEPIAGALAQLEEYFRGDRSRFELALAIRGTPFQRSVWAALRSIPCGETRSYAEIAQAIGRPGASRAVGMANATNPLPVVVPCHRVIGADGRLTGFGGGLETKLWLLELEGALPGGPQRLF